MIFVVEQRKESSDEHRIAGNSAFLIHYPLKWVGVLNEKMIVFFLAEAQRRGGLLTYKQLTY